MFSIMISVNCTGDFFPPDLASTPIQTVSKKAPQDRIKTLLDKINSIRRSEQRGYEISDQAKMTSHKYRVLFQPTGEGEGISSDRISGTVQKKFGGITIYAIYNN